MKNHTTYILLLIGLIVFNSCEKEAAKPYAQAIVKQPLSVQPFVTMEGHLCWPFSVSYSAPSSVIISADYIMQGDEGWMKTVNIYANVTGAGTYFLSTTASGSYVTYCYSPTGGENNSYARTDSIDSGTLTVGYWNLGSKTLSGTYNFNFFMFGSIMSDSGSFSLVWK